MAQLDFPSETIGLPSKGWFYKEGHPLSGGTLDVFYMTAKHEDILTSRNLIQKGVVIKKLLEALLATPGVKYTDLLIGDKNALMVAARVLGYGKDYEVEVKCTVCDARQSDVIDLTQLKEREVEFSDAQKGKNEFFFTLPISKKLISFKLLTEGDEEQITTQVESLRRNAGKSEPGHEVTTRMWYSILTVDGESDRNEVRRFVERMPARDAQAFREHVRKVTPDIEFTYTFACETCGHEEVMEVPFTVGFFWPKS